MSSPSPAPRLRIASPAPFGYRPGLDGVRGLAVAAVFLYHADVSWMPGGFLGVDTFFVLSGYLITALLVNEWWSKGGIGLAEFWKRRARRLLPAVYGLLTAVVAMALVFRSELERVLDEVPSAVLYVYNWMLVGSETSYFESMGRPSPLRHLWSLAVEEQFYLLWPLVALWALRRGGRRHLVVVAGIGAAVSVALMVARHVPGADASGVYYATDARAVGLLLGAVAAIVWHPGRSIRIEHRLAVTIAGVLGLAGLGWSFLAVDEFSPALYPGGFVLVSVASLVVAVAAADPRNVVARLMGSPPLRWVGTRSYSIYLWHWPVVVFTRPGVDVPLGDAPALALRLALTLVLAEMSYRLVEARFRWSPGSVPDGWEGRPPRLVPRGVGALAGAGALASVLTMAVAIGWVVQPPGEEPELTATVAADATPETIALGDPEPTTGTDATTPDAAADEPEAPTTGVAAPASTTPADAAGSADTSVQTTTSTTQPTVTPTLAVASAAPEDAEVSTPSTTTAPPPTSTTTPPPRTVTAIGDSVMAGAVEELRAAYVGSIEVDAEVSRSIEQGVEVIARHADAEDLGDVVVVHLGTNGPIDAEHVARIMDVAGSEREVAFLTVKLPRRWEEQVNEVLRAEVATYPNAVLVDWHAASDGHQDWFAGDGIHIQAKPGAAAYADLVSDALTALDG